MQQAETMCDTSRPSRKGMSRLVRRFRRNKDGTTAIEFAMISVPFMGILFAIFETAFVFFATEALETAVSEAARTVMTGQVQGMASVTNAAQFKDQLICNPAAPRVSMLPSFIDCTKLIVDVRRVTGNTFANADMTKAFITNPTETYDPGGASCVVVVRAAYPMPVYLSILSTTGMSANGTVTSGQTSWNGSMVHMLLGTAAFRNEPFPGTTLVPC